jgi:transcriptional regulator with XRE-family HTH domain
MRKGAEEPTEFGYFLMSKMAAHEPPLSQAELARQVGIGQATISRWIFKEQRPEPGKLRLLAPVLGVSYSELLTIAGHGEPATEISEALTGLRPDIDPLAAELSAMLNESSPLKDTDRALLRAMIDRLIDPYRRTMRTRRSA